MTASETIDEAESDPRWEHSDAVVNGIRLHYVEAGSGRPVVFLHGFPECWYSWHHQLPAFAEAGYHAIAPDLRGYNRSEKPDGVPAYRIETLVEDVRALIETVSEDGDGAIVVGHDWGGIVAWELAAREPDVVERLAILNAPHPKLYERDLRSRDQLLKSWYVIWFQLPIVPERVLGAFDAALVGRLLENDPVNPEAFSDADIARYRTAASKPGALTAAINYYRAAGRAMARKFWSRLRSDGSTADPPGSFQAGRIEVPTLVLWGLQDRALSAGLTHGLDRWVDDLRIERFPEASHWLQVDCPDTVTDEVLTWLKE